MAKIIEKKEIKTIKKAPVVVVMGHIDHGKSTLLDYIRKTKIADKEAGGITQKISAYEFPYESKDGKKSMITFIDTPGHESFSQMRSRGARVADIAILVVSAEDGVKPQTIDAYTSILKAKIPHIVAINKIDKPNANIERTKLSLAENEIYLEGYGGDISGVSISAIRGDGINDLLDTVLLLADINNFEADLNSQGTGIIIEANRDSKRGVGASIIVKNGKIKKGGFVASENAVAPVRNIENFKGENIEEGVPGEPISITGFSEIPRVGSELYYFESKKEAEKYIEEATEIMKEENKKILPKKDGSKTLFPIILKADNAGSLEAINYEINKLKHLDVDIKIITSGVGNISETDIKTASGIENSLVLGFGVNIESQAVRLSENLKIRIEKFDIIYKMIELVVEETEKRRPRKEVEEVVGSAKILKFFSRTKERQIVGGKVLGGEIKLGGEVIIFRHDKEIERGRIRELQKQKVKCESVAEGYEFGAQIEAKIEMVAGDKIECIVKKII